MLLSNLTNVSTSVVRSLLGLINLLCIVTSLILIMFVAYDDNVLKEYGDATTLSDTSDGNDMLLFAAVFMLFAGILGCVASMQDSYNLLYEYICVLIVMLALTLPISIYVFVQRATLDFKTQSWLQTQFYTNTTQDADTITKWDEIQHKYGCCGFVGPSDFVLLNRPLLVSCCPRAYNAPAPDIREKLFKECVRSVSFHMAGCNTQLVRSLQNDRYMLLGIGILSFWFELAGVLTALCIAHETKKSTSLQALFGS